MAVTILPSANPPGYSLSGKPSELDADAFHPQINANEWSFGAHLDILAAHALLVSAAKSVCQKYDLMFTKLSPIQRKFITHYRCNFCGMLPIYHLNTMHVKRVRCRKCGQLITFRSSGKYGRMRKAVAFEVSKEINGDILHAE